MGYYLNPGNSSFRETIRSRIYVDKTQLIAWINGLMNTKEKYLCVSRPRRFGKTVTLEMLAAYYSCGCNSAELFRGLEIERDATYQEHLNRYDVLFLNMQQFLSEASSGKLTDYLVQEVLRELRKEYGEIFVETGRQFVFLIDEWDCVMREKQEAEDMQRRYLDFMRSLLKDQAYVALAYMTGILPVKKYGSHSALNMFYEYSMTDQKELEEYTGFTEKEVKELCDKFDMDFQEMGRWYDGYLFKNVRHVYNPRSVVEAVRCRDFSGYWVSTETYEALKNYMDMDFDGLRADMVQMLGGGQIRVNTRSFQNDMWTFKTKDDVLTLLIHLGYLAYDSGKKETFIPNKEIVGEFETSMSVSGWGEVVRVLKASEDLLGVALACDEERVARGLDKAHSEAAVPVGKEAKKAASSGGTGAQGSGADRNETLAYRVSAVSIVVNLLLSLAKLAAGVIGKSSAMVSDAVHSASDVFSTFVVIIGVKMAGKKADEDHPYGHERMECVAALILAMLLGLVGAGIGISGIGKIAARNYGELEIPSRIPLAAAVLSIGAKEWMFWYTRAAARRINSGALMADAWHHRSDALSSVGSFVGILFARLGFPVMDPLAGIVISLCILKAAYDIFKDGLDKMVDHRCDIEVEGRMRDTAMAVEGVQGIDDLKTRLFGARIYVDMEILVDRELKLGEAHEIAEKVHDSIEGSFPDCKHCMIHVNPTRE